MTPTFDNQKDHSTSELIRQAKQGDRYAIEARREVINRQIETFSKHLGCEVKKHKKIMVSIDGNEPEFALFSLLGLAVVLQTSSGNLTIKDLKRVSPV